jgi:hypothetical protein
MPYGTELPYGLRRVNLGGILSVILELSTDIVGSPQYLCRSLAFDCRLSAICAVLLVVFFIGFVKSAQTASIALNNTVQ